jgi:hypothetical protein
MSKWLTAKAKAGKISRSECARRILLREMKRDLAKAEKEAASG